jgi:hypothetical protein
MMRIHFADRSCAALLNWTLEDCHANKNTVNKKLIKAALKPLRCPVRPAAIAFEN